MASGRLDSGTGVAWAPLTGALRMRLVALCSFSNPLGWVTMWQPVTPGKSCEIWMMKAR